MAHADQGLKCDFIFPADYRRKKAQIFADRDQNLRLSACFFCGDLREMMLRRRKRFPIIDLFPDNFLTAARFVIETNVEPVHPGRPGGKVELCLLSQSLLRQQSSVQVE